MTEVKPGIDLTGRMVGPTRAPFLSWTTPGARVMPVSCTLHFPGAGGGLSSLVGIMPGVLPRARVTWGAYSADQWVEFDLCSCTITQVCSSMTLELYILPELYSAWAAGTFPAPLPIRQGCSVLIGLSDGIHSSRGLTFTEMARVIGDGTNLLGNVPPWARRVSLWEVDSGFPYITAPPSYYGGLQVQRVDAAVPNCRQQIPLSECFRKFAPLGPGCSPSSNVLYNGDWPAAPSGLQVSFELEV